MEKWKQIPSFENYEVSSLGKVKRVTAGKGTKGGKMHPSLNMYGYPVVHLSKGNKDKVLSVHRLVAAAFVANPDDLPQVNHKDGIKTNNASKNLEWCSPLENMRHAAKLGLHGDGVFFIKSRSKWAAAYCPTPYKQVIIGRTFSAFEEAKLARDKKMKEKS